jgi:2Fe-2S ferredoxin
LGKITFANTGESVPFEEDESLLELSEREKVPVPFGCYAGHCAACMVRIEEGRENISAPNVFEEYTLTRQELEQGWRLGCQIKLTAGEVVLAPWSPDLMTEK